METQTMFMKIEMYDPACKQPPYSFITLHDTFEVQVPLPENDPGGVQRAEVARRQCSKRGHEFNFYSGSGTKEDPKRCVVYGGGYTMDDRDRDEAADPLSAVMRLAARTMANRDLEGFEDPNEE